jgi:predicted Zn finger-like uncharacterized protein
MKIVCDSCATKYSISDDKVRGKVFKIRCKKCSHIIVVRGTNDGAAAAGQATPAATDGGGWHLVVDGDQVGPLPDADVKGRISRGEINAETYIWKDGFADWVKLSSVSDFADELAANPTSADSGVDHFTETNGAGESATADVMAAASPANSGGLFGSISVAPAVSDSDLGPGGEVGGFSPSPSGGHSAGFSPGHSPDLGGGDLFAAQASPRPSTDDNHWSLGGGGGAAMAGHDGGRIESLTAQRHENSVLFSLSNLQSLAAPGGAAKPTPSPSSAPSPGSEGSGLIDIRAMAASTLGSPSEGRGGSGDDLPSFGAFSPAAPVLLSLPTSSSSSKWIWPAIIVMVGFAGLIVWMAIKILSDKPATVAETAAAPASAPIAAAGSPATPKSPEPAAAAPAVPPTPTQPAIPDDKLPPRESPKGSEGASAASAPAAHPGRKLKGGKRTALNDTGVSRSGSAAASAAPVAAASPDPTEKKPAKGSLDDLLESAISGKAKPASKPRGEDELRKPVADAPASGPLSKNAVVSGMNGVKGKVSECYNQYKVPGMVMVTVVIGKSGKVSSASATGKFAGTPTGNCVEKAIKTASFPPSDGLTTPYPFVLK